MGFNTTVIVLNDALHHIETDPEFGGNLARAIMMVQRGEQVDVPARAYDKDGNARSSHANAATVIESHHADYNAIVAVGGNCATKLGTTYGSHHKEEDKLDILRQLAEQLGYSLRKKPTQ